MNLPPEVEAARQRRLAALLNANKLSITAGQQTLGDGNMQSTLVISYKGKTFPAIPLAPSQTLYRRN